MADARVARDPFCQLHASGRIASFEELLGALVREIQTCLHVDDGLAHHVEAEVPGLDDARVHGADRNLVDAFAADGGKEKRLPLVGWRVDARVLAQRVFPFGPEAVFDERALMRMTDDADAE